MSSPVISSQKLIAATRGNPDLLEVLQSVQNVSNQQQAVSGTTPVTSPVAGQPNPAAPVPPQAVGSAMRLGQWWRIYRPALCGDSELSSIAVSCTFARQVLPVMGRTRKGA